MNFKQIEHIAQEIKTIEIQGATNIAKAAFEVMKTEVENQEFGSIDELKSFFQKSRVLLESARSTEPMMFNGMKYVAYKMKTEIKRCKNVQDMKRIIIKSFVEFEEIVKENDKRIIEYGSALIKPTYKVFTHCHSSAVIRTLVAAHKKIKNFEVRNTETRPLYQGRKTSIDLLEDGIKTTMVTDDSAPYFIDKTIDKSVEIDVVIIGCDALKLNGNAINKVGSFSISLSSKVSKIPLYIIGNLTKVDAENKVKIETRPGSELRPEAPKELTIVNYAFDTVPSKNITGIVTEFGIIKPRDIKKYTKKYYPWMYK